MRVPVKTGAFTCKFAQRIVDGLTLTERKNGGISRHGVSLLSGGSGRLDTRLDTPPSINRRHLDSRIAQPFLTEGSHDRGSTGGASGGSGGHYGAIPGPIAGAGLPILAVGYGAYWLIRRYRRKPN
jgi:hypothetical protein